jgi:hypothetical protein
MIKRYEVGPGGADLKVVLEWATEAMPDTFEQVLYEDNDPCYELEPLNAKLRTRWELLVTAAKITKRKCKALEPGGAEAHEARDMLLKALRETEEAIAACSTGHPVCALTRVFWALEDQCSFADECAKQGWWGKVRWHIRRVRRGPRLI